MMSPTTRLRIKLNGLSFLVDSVKKGLCGMVLDVDTAGGINAIGNNSDSKVQLSSGELAAELDTCHVALLSHDKLLKHAVKERNEHKAKLELVLKDLEFAWSSIVIDETEYNICVVHMSNFSTMQTSMLPC